MNDAPQDDLTMAGHAKMLARSADALAKELGKPFPPWMALVGGPHLDMASRESSHDLASLVSQLADVVADLAGSLQARIDREDDLR